jgi:hypothetical protein
LLSVGWCLLCLFAPWIQVHPSDAMLVQSLSRAPIWSHGYDRLPGATLDAVEFLLEAGMILFACLFMLTIDGSARSRYSE